AGRIRAGKRCRNPRAEVRRQSRGSAYFVSLDHRRYGLELAGSGERISPGNRVESKLPYRSPLVWSAVNFAGPNGSGNSTTKNSATTGSTFARDQQGSGSRLYLCSRLRRSVATVPEDSRNRANV